MSLPPGGGGGPATDRRGVAQRRTQGKSGRPGFPFYVPPPAAGTATSPARGEGEDFFSQPPNRAQWCSAPNPVAVAGVPGTSDWNRWAAPYRGQLGVPSELGLPDSANSVQ
jgi:hypothetical protein